MRKFLAFKSEKTAVQHDMRTTMNRRKRKPTKEQVKAVMDEVDLHDLPDGAHWAMIHEKLGLEYGDVFDYITADPKFFNAVKTAKATL